MPIKLPLPLPSAAARWASILMLPTLVFVSLVNIVILRKLLYAAPYYQVSFSFLLNICFSLVLVPAQMLSFWFIMPDDARERRTPWWFFFVSALLDGIGNFLSLVGGARTSGSLQLLVSKLDLALTMALTWAFLRNTLHVRYRWTHVTGATLIIIGVCAASLPSLISGGGRNNSVSGIFLICLSAVPGSVSMLFKEVMMKKHHMDPLFANAGTSPWQLLVSMATLPLLIVPGMSDLSASDLPANLHDGIMCLIVGRDTDPNPAYVDCSSAAILYWLFFAFNLAFNLILVAAMKFGSAVVVSMSSALLLPLGALVFSFSFVMDNNAVPIHSSTLIALFFVLVGFIFFKIKSEHWNNDDKLSPAPSHAFTELGVDADDDDDHLRLLRDREHLHT
jgi:drug/metabolite transporter (DMT)-like permease